MVTSNVLTSSKVRKEDALIGTSVGITRSGQHSDETGVPMGDDDRQTLFGIASVLRSYSVNV